MNGPKAISYVLRVAHVRALLAFSDETFATQPQYRYVHFDLDRPRIWATDGLTMLTILQHDRARELGLDKIDPYAPAKRFASIARRVFEIVAEREIAEVTVDFGKEEHRIGLGSSIDLVVRAERIGAPSAWAVLPRVEDLGVASTVLDVQLLSRLATFEKVEHEQPWTLGIACSGPLMLRRSASGEEWVVLVMPLAVHNEPWRASIEAAAKQRYGGSA